jgi:hypothetical protein
MISGIFGNHKAARVGDQIDAKVATSKGFVQQALMATQRFDMYEQQLHNLAAQVQQEAPLLAQQFTLIQQQINNDQQTIQQCLNALANELKDIDALTDKIQN